MKQGLAALLSFLMATFSLGVHNIVFFYVYLIDYISGSIMLCLYLTGFM